MLKIYSIWSYILVKFFGYINGSFPPYEQIPKLGSINKITLSFFKIEKAIFKEKPLCERFSEDEYRYYFELIDGCQIWFQPGICYKQTEYTSWEYDKKNSIAIEDK